MKLNIKIIALIFLSILSCSFLKKTDYVDLIHHITENFSTHLKKDYDLHYYGGGGAMFNDIQEVSLRYVTTKSLTISEARKLYVNVTEDLLNRINENKKIRPYLHNFPFEPHNLSIMISFEKCTGKPTDAEPVALMFIGKNNTLCYHAFDRDKKQPYYSIHREPYEEALRIVKQNQPSNLLIGYN